MHKYFVFILILGLLQNLSAQAASFQAQLDSVIYVKSQKPRMYMTLMAE